MMVFVLQYDTVQSERPFAVSCFYSYRDRERMFPEPAMVSARYVDADSPALTDALMHPRTIVTAYPNLDDPSEWFDIKPLSHDEAIQFLDSGFVPSKRVAAPRDGGKAW